MNDQGRSPSINKLLQDVIVPTEEKVPQVIAPATEIPITPEIPIGQTTPPVEEIKQPEPISDEIVEAGADIAIGMFDFSQNNLFKFFVNRKKRNRMESLLGENHRDKLETLISEVEAGKTADQFTTNDISALRIEKNVQELLKDLPLSDQDKEALKKPLMAIMKKKGGTLPPEYALGLAVLQILGGRTAEIYML